MTKHHPSLCSVKNRADNGPVFLKVIGLPADRVSLLQQLRLFASTGPLNSNIRSSQ